ncbi:MAG: hypothetical protein IPM98_06185 [Lewinellaceae bacterium]|nr:hypothetical protein [Lewinellaceae bacterium]
MQRYIIYLFVFVCFSTDLYAQACYDWEYSYPFPTANYLNGVSAVDADHAWAVGDGGTIIHTADGGASWVVQCPPVAANTILEDVSFANTTTGWAVGRTTDATDPVHRRRRGQLVFADRFG